MTVSEVDPVNSSTSAPPRKRLLLLKLGAIGDAVMAIPAASAMHDAGYNVTWIAGAAVVPVLTLYPWIRVVPVDDTRLVRGTRSERIGEALRLWQRLWAFADGQPYDLCAVLYYDRRYRLLMRPVRARQRVALSRSERQTRLLPGRHHTDEYARILTGRLDTETPVHLSPVPAPNLPPSPLGLLPGRDRVILVPAGARNALRDDALRRWPAEAYVEVAEQLLLAGHEVVLVGGAEDAWVSPYFSALRAREPERLRDAIGQFTLVETLALMDSAGVTVTHDTGPLHLAGLTSTSIVAIFGPTDPRGRLPQRANSVALWGGEDFACRPCYDGHDYAPCSHNGCVREVTPAMVFARVQEALQDRRESRSRPPRVLTVPPAPIQPEGSFALLRPESLEQSR